MEPGVQYMCLEGRTYDRSGARGARPCNPNGHPPGNVLITGTQSLMMFFVVILHCFRRLGNYFMPLPSAHRYGVSTLETPILLLFVAGTRLASRHLAPAARTARLRRWLGALSTAVDERGRLLDGSGGSSRPRNRVRRLSWCDQHQSPPS